MSDDPKMTYVTLFDPFVYDTLKSVVGKHILVETERGNVRGKLKKVVPDHVVIEADEDSTFFVRIQQIIWIMPID